MEKTKLRINVRNVSYEDLLSKFCEEANLRWKLTDGYIVISDPPKKTKITPNSSVILKLHSFWDWGFCFEGAGITLRGLLR